MKFAAFLLPLVPAALAAECSRDAGCPGCGTVDSVGFTQSGNTYTATSPSYGAMTMDDTTVSVENTSNKWLLFCAYGSICVPLGAGDSCTTARQSTDSPALGLQVWSQ